LLYTSIREARSGIHLFFYEITTSSNYYYFPTFFVFGFGGSFLQ
jgi:hypothetical protein